MFNNVFLETMYETDKEFLTNNEKGVLNKEINDILSEIPLVSSDLNMKISMDSIRIFTSRNERFYIEIDEVLKIMEEYGNNTIAEAFNSIIDYYKEKAPITKENTYIVVLSKDIDKISENPVDQACAIKILKELKDSNINIVRK